MIELLSKEIKKRIKKKPKKIQTAPKNTHLLPLCCRLPTDIRVQKQGRHVTPELF